jgi:hypothetical protein
MCRLIITHLGKVSFPETFSKKARQRLKLPHSQRLGQGQVNCGGIRLYAQDARGLIEQLLI